MLSLRQFFYSVVKGSRYLWWPWEVKHTEPATTVAEVTAETKACDCNETIKESTESICVVKENEMQVTVFLITSFICLLRVVYCSYSSHHLHCVLLAFILFYWIFFCLLQDFSICSCFRVKLQCVWLVRATVDISHTVWAQVCGGQWIRGKLAWREKAKSDKF